MANIVDRRLSGKNKSAENREKFKKRYKQHINHAVKDAIASRKIEDIKGSKDIVIPKDDITEPTFRKSKDRDFEEVFPGNGKYVPGDRIFKPEDGDRSNGASNSGEGEDDFLFTLSPEEFMNSFFDDLELPNNIKKSLNSEDEYKLHRAGFVTSGIPSNLNIIRSYKNSLARKIALEGYYDEEIEKVEDADKLLLIEEKKSIPLLEEIDLRYNHREKKPEPTTKAVIIMLMDVSGSMGEREKDLAKRFFILLYLFIKKNYGKAELVFIRHTTEAQEVDEETFFYGRETGGTVVSCGINLINEIIEERYLAKGYNIYVAQASDGDNWPDDNEYVVDLLKTKTLKYIQYMFYLQVHYKSENKLLDNYEMLEEQVNNFATGVVISQDRIYPIFRDFFEGKK
jgi:uncharacterized sporulation protein YeaH/YhbH (DUF444 family)